MNRGVRLFIVAGEPSGDLLGAALIKGLQRLHDEADLTLRMVGGPKMENCGPRSLFPMEELSVMGVAEILPRLPNLLRRIRQTADAVIEMAPDVLITIDSPDFSLRVSKRVKKALPDLKVIHFVAPSVWAWRPGRAAKMASHVDHVLALLPFEPPYMEAAGMTCDFVGHPVAHLTQPDPASVAVFRERHGIGATQPFLLVLPGSRKGEVSRLGPVFAKVATQIREIHPEVAVMVGAAPSVASEVRALFAPDQTGWPKILEPEGMGSNSFEALKQTCFAAADAALAASGTVSLELAAAGTPCVIGYAVNPVTAMMARRLLKLDTFTLTNLVTGTRSVPEFLQENCTAEKLTPAVSKLLFDATANGAQRAAADRAMQLLGRNGPEPGLRAAESVMRVLAD